MLYLSPHQPDEIPKLLGTFSIQARFKGDLFASGTPINGVNINMNFSTLDGNKVGVLDAHGSSASSSMLGKITDALGKLGPYASKALIQGKWAITETKEGITFTRIPEEEKKKKKEENKQ